MLFTEMIKMRSWFLLVLVITVGCARPIPHMPRGSVWRASTFNGDKPGVGIELETGWNKMLGTFFILDPDMPHDFGSGVAFSMRVLDHNGTRLDCEVRLSPAETLHFSLEFRELHGAGNLSGFLLERGPDRTPVELTFSRVK